MRVFSQGSRSFSLSARPTRTDMERIRHCVADTGEAANFINAVFKNSSFVHEEQNKARLATVMCWLRKQRLRKKIYAAVRRTGGTVVSQ